MGTDYHVLTKYTGLGERHWQTLKWAQQVEAEFGMQCSYEESAKEDRVSFTRSGVNGVLHVTGDHFDLDAKLGFLLGAFKGRIEAEIVKNLDDLLAPKPAVKKASAKKQ